MVKFRHIPKPRNFLSRREQWRMLLLVMSLGLVVVLMMEARDPKNWEWFAALGTGSSTPQDEPARRERPPIDDRPRPAPLEKQTPGTSASPDSVPAEQDATGRYFPGVNPEHFDVIRDDTTFQNDERHAWKNLFEVLNGPDFEAKLRRASPERVSYTQLFRQPDEFRGALVTVRGTVRRANPIGAPTKDFPVQRYYRAWLSPDDNRSSLIVVYCLNLPQGFPTGMEIAQEAEITGFFFKRWAYSAVDGIRTAPTLAARTVRWQKASEVVEPTPADPGTLLLVAGVAVAVCLFVSVYVYTRTRPTRAEEAGPPPKLDALRDVDVPSEAGPPLGRTDGEGTSK